MLAENWGAASAERAERMACDEILPGAAVGLHRAITVDAAPATVFRWLCQLRVAPYSYDLLDNFGRRSPRKLTVGVEALEVGQRFMSIFRLATFESDRQITLRARSTAVTYATRPFGDSTRLVVRVLSGHQGPIRKAAPVLALGDLVMIRKQLLTLKELAESSR